MDIGQNGKIVFADNMDSELGVPSLEDESVALTFTSPPYFNYIEYKGGKGLGNQGETYSEYLLQIENLLEMIYSKTVPGGRCVINISNMKSRKSVEGKSFVYPIVSDFIRLAGGKGFVFFDEVIWDKMQPRPHSLGGRPLFGSYPYPPTPKIVDISFEQLLVLVKEGKRKVDKSIKEYSKLTIDEWREFTKGIWRIPTDRDPNHPATFPVALAERVIRLYSFVGDRVLDPYVGTGTTVIASELWDRRGIGFEISSDYQGSIRDRAAKHLNSQLELL